MRFRSKITKRRRRGDYVLQLRAAIAAEEVGKAEQRSVLGADEQQAAGDRAEAMGKRHQQHGDHQRQIEKIIGA